MNKHLKIYTKAELEEKKNQTKINAEYNINQVFMRNQAFFGSIQSRVDTIMDENSSIKVKRGNMRKLALEINEVLMPNAACKNTCSHCCNIPVSVMTYEAININKLYPGHEFDFNAGVNATELNNNSKMESYHKHNNKPCPFLKEGACSIYNDRPISCITHHSLDANDFFCDLSIPSEESLVPSVDLSFFHQVLAILSANEKVGDIREFFK